MNDDQKMRVRKIIALKQLMDGASEIALEALRELCCADEPNFCINTQEMAYRAGKKDVWRNISRIMELPLDKLEEKENEDDNVLD